MKHVFVRPVRPDDAARMVEWSSKTPSNLFDPEVVKYSTTFTRCAYDEDGPLVYMPVQMPYLIEAVATRPGASEMQIAAGLKTLTQDLVSRAHQVGVGEIYFLSEFEPMQDMAEKHGFRRLPWDLFRMKLSELETKNVKHYVIPH